MSKKIIEKLLNGDLPIDFNWNADTHRQVAPPVPFPLEPTTKQVATIEIVSEDLRDGLHGIAQYPTVSGMIEYLSLLYTLGIRNFTVGIYPGNANKIDASIKLVLSKMREKFPKATPIVLTIATKEGVAWIASCKKINSRLNAIIFMGTAPSRLLVEEWKKTYILDRLRWAVKEATKKYHIGVIGATEHTTQTPPEFLRDIIQTVVESGAKYFCIADTIGIARPVGVTRIISFTRRVLDDIGAKDVVIDWHGHDDLGNGQGNAMTAIASGAQRIHTVARGIGERAGNTRMESVLLNCVEILKENRRSIPWNMKMMHTVLSTYDTLTQNPAPMYGPLGKRSFSTSLGIHTAAILKARLLAQSAKRMKQKNLAIKLETMAQKIYSALDPHAVGRKHEIHVGPWSGKSTVQLAYLELGNDPHELTEELIVMVLTTVKQLGRELAKDELIKLLNHNHADIIPEPS